MILLRIRRTKKEVITISGLTDSDLKAYKQYNENFYSTGHYKSTQHNLHVHDVVRINDSLYHDNGYEGHMGIVQSLSGLNNYVHVMAYNSRAERYWVCGFSEYDLVKLPITLDNVNLQLKGAYLDWLKRNDFQFASNDFKEQLKKSVPNEILSSNIVCIDFINKKTKIQ